MWFLTSRGSSGGGRRAKHLITSLQHSETRAKGGGPNRKRRKRVIQGASFKAERTLDLSLEGHTQSHPTCTEVGYWSWHYRLTAQHIPGLSVTQPGWTLALWQKHLAPLWLYFPGQPSQQLLLWFFVCLGISFIFSTVPLFSIAKEQILCLIK